MDWNAIGALGEVIGAAGVIFSLMYLGTQIRSSTKQANADAIYNSQKAQADIVETFGDVENARLFAKLEKGEPLEAYENVQVDFIVARESESDGDAGSSKMIYLVRHGGRRWGRSYSVPRAGVGLTLFTGSSTQFLR